MKISLMWPTRDRVPELIFSLSSFIQRAKDNSNIEYIVVVDPDDEETQIALERITPMVYCYGAEIICLMSDKRYGYAELEQYQNRAGEIFSGECLFICNDDLICLSNDWDEEFRKVLKPVIDKPSWIGLSPLNEKWKGSTTFVGINRKWYDVVGRVSGTRATDGYLPLVGEGTKIKPILPNIKLLHLQRGKGAMEYFDGDNWGEGNRKFVHGLSNDETAAGYSSKNPVPPKYEFHEGIGKERLDEDIRKLLEWRSINE